MLEGSKVIQLLPAEDWFVIDWSGGSPSYRPLAALALVEDGWITGVETVGGKFSLIEDNDQTTFERGEQTAEAVVELAKKGY